MATIGSFKKVGNDFQGEIVTLSLQAKGVRIVAEDQPLATTTPPATASTWAGRRSGPPGRSAPKRAATTSRSSSTIPPSTRRSTRTCSTTRAAKATPCSGRGRGRTASETRPPPSPARAARAGLFFTTAQYGSPTAPIRSAPDLGSSFVLLLGLQNSHLAKNVIDVADTSREQCYFFLRRGRAGLRPLGKGLGVVAPLGG